MPCVKFLIVGAILYVSGDVVRIDSDEANASAISAQVDHTDFNVTLREEQEWKSAFYPPSLGPNTVDASMSTKRHLTFGAARRSSPSSLPPNLPPPPVLPPLPNAPSPAMPGPQPTYQLSTFPPGTPAFDGTYRHCIADEGSCISGGLARSVLMWLKYTGPCTYAATSDNRIMSMGYNTGYGTFLDFYINSRGLGCSNGLRTNFGINGNYADWGAFIDSHFNDVFPQSTWVHFAFTFTEKVDGQHTLKVYLDGTEVVSSSSNFNINTDCSHATCKNYIPGAYNSQNMWIGEIQGVRIFDAALSESEVTMWKNEYIPS